MPLPHLSLLYILLVILLLKSPARLKIKKKLVDHVMCSGSDSGFAWSFG